MRYMLDIDAWYSTKSNITVSALENIKWKDTQNLHLSPVNKLLVNVAIFTIYNIPVPLPPLSTRLTVTNITATSLRVEWENVIDVPAEVGQYYGYSIEVTELSAPLVINATVTYDRSQSTLTYNTGDRLEPDTTYKVTLSGYRQHGEQRDAVHIANAFPFPRTECSGRFIFWFSKYPQANLHC